MLQFLLRLCILISLFSVSASAGTPIGRSNTTFLGYSLGLSSYSFNEGSGSEFAHDFEAGYFRWGNWGFGGFLTTHGIVSSAGGTSLSLSASHFGFQGLYRFDQQLDGFYAGLRVGVAQVGRAIVAINNTIASDQSEFLIGPRVGYDFEVAKKFWIGPQASSYFHSLGSSWNFLVSFKYWIH